MNKPQQVAEMLTTAVDEWYDKQSAGVIADKVNKYLNDKFLSILDAYMGISTSWGEVILNTSNAEFFANGELAAKIQKAAMAYVSQATIPPLTEKKKK